MADKPRASCVVLIHPETGDILSATRRGTTDQWGLIGGKQDAGELPTQCAFREYQEETGLNLIYQPLFVFECEDDFGYLCSVYLVVHDVDVEFAVRAFETPQTREGDILVGFIPWKTLVTGPFANYNWHTLQQLLATLIKDNIHADR